MTTPTCTGRGDTDGGHCCWIEGQLCQFYDNGCSLYDQWGTLTSNPEWLAAPVGKAFAERWPGLECKDWPQNIPTVMTVGIGLCCWRD